MGERAIPYGIDRDRIRPCRNRWVLLQRPVFETRRNTAQDSGLGRGDIDRRYVQQEAEAQGDVGQLVVDGEVLGGKWTVVQAPAGDVVESTTKSTTSSRC